MFRPVLHLLLHFAIPLLVARRFYPKIALKAFMVMMATMLVDLDHLLADPIYDPGRCSIGFHPLHQYPMLVVYAALAVWSPTRLVGIGLVIHMFLDGVDCVWMLAED